MTIKEAAQRAGVHWRTVFRWIQAGKLQAEKVMKKGVESWEITEADLAACLQANQGHHGGGETREVEIPTMIVDTLAVLQAQLSEKDAQLREKDNQLLRRDHEVSRLHEMMRARDEEIASLRALPARGDAARLAANDEPDPSTTKKRPWWKPWGKERT